VQPVSIDDQALIHDLARDVVAAIAPEELDSFDQRIEGYFARLASGEVPALPKDVPIGSGMIDPTFVTTVVGAAVSAGLLFVFEAFRTSVQEELVETAKEALRRLFRREPRDPAEAVKVERGPDGEPQVLVFNLVLPSGPARTALSAASIEEAIVTTLQQQGFGKRRARSVAKAVVARFAVDDHNA